MYTLDRYTVHDGEIVGWLYVHETPGGNWTDWVVRHLDGGVAGHTSVQNPTVLPRRGPLS